jgi:hypothetical protein
MPEMRMALAILMACTVLFILGHIVRAELTKDYPPVSCQVFGGTWDIYNGWSCNG